MMKTISNAVGMPTKLLSSCLVIALLCVSCQSVSCKMEPRLVYVPQARLIESLPSPFPGLTRDEVRQDWGKELHVALTFAHEKDLYRAITSFKRALIFLPPQQWERKLQIEYSLLQCYYWGLKYQDALDVFDKSSLHTVTDAFPSFRDLLIMLFDCYMKTEQCEKAELIYKHLESIDPETAARLRLSEAFQEGDLQAINCLASSVADSCVVETFVDEVLLVSKSIQKARNLNALLPGAGYYYVGLKKAAVTSFLINSLFIGASYYFIANGNVPAGLITASLETGWYMGGINGAGLAAKEYNERLYETNAKEFMVRNRLFPMLMLQKSF